MAVIAPPPVAMSAKVAAPGAASARSSLGDSAALGVSALHFGAALCFLLAGAVGMVLVAPVIAAGLFLDTQVVAVTHLFTLGWLTTTIFGALYQLLPVALGASVRWVRLGYVSIALVAPGIASFVAGVATNDDPIRHLGLALVMPGLLLGIVNIGASLPRAPRRDVTWWAVVVALAALLTTIVLGGVLVHNLKTGVLAGARVRVLALHMHIALVGWAFATIVGISQRLLPMFLLAHGVDDRWSRRALAFLAAGTMLLAGGLLAPNAPVTWVGAFALAGGLASFIVQARRFYAARVRPKLDPGLRIVATGIVATAAAGVLGLSTLASGTSYPRVATAYGAAAVLSVMLYVVGHFYKIVPFLAWTMRYRVRTGHEPVPAIADLYSARLAVAQWIVMSVATASIIVGTLVGHAQSVRAGAVLLLVGVLLFASQIIRLAIPAPARRA